jgi:hypothetical protein
MLTVCVRLLKDFTNLWILGFGNDAAGLWESADLLRPSCQTVNNSLCILWRALSDVGMVRKMFQEPLISSARVRR